MKNNSDYKERTREELFELHRAVESSSEAIFITDINGIITYINPGFTNLYGFTSEEVVGKCTPRILKSGMMKEEAYQNFWKAILNKEVVKRELINKTRDGRLLTVEVSVNPILNSTGDIKGFIGVQYDITARKRLELENQVNYEITQGITTTSNLDELLKLIHHSLAKVVYAENCFVALRSPTTGLFSFPYFVDKFDPVPSPSELKKSCSSYVFRTARPLLLTQKIFDNLASTNEVELIGSNSPSWIGVPLQTPAKVIGVLVLQNYERENVYSEGDVRFLTSIGSQIAFAIERKQAETALLERESDLNESQKIAGLGSFKLDLTTGTWTSSKTLDSILGIDENYDRSANGWTEFIHPEWRGIMSSYMANEVIKNHLRFDKEYKIIRKNDGEVRWVHGLGELIFDPDTNLNSLVGSIMDVNQRKSSEEEIKLKNEQLKLINSEKDKFFSIIAHDLLGPLSSFVAATEIITEDIQNMSIGEIKEITGSMKTSAINIYSLLENLLEWARLRRGGVDFVPVKLNLSRTIEDCINVLYETARKKQIEIRKDVAENLDVTADKHMIDSVLRNLVSNAVKFTNEGGRVLIEAFLNSDNNIEVRVSDSGIGMTPELKSKLFHLNEKTSRQGTAGEPSTGLGLLLCKEFVEKHGGEIWVESKVGKGSTFCFTVSNKKQK